MHLPHRLIVLICATALAAHSGSNDSRTIHRENVCPTSKDTENSGCAEGGDAFRLLRDASAFVVHGTSLDGWTPTRDFLVREGKSRFLAGVAQIRQCGRRLHENLGSAKECTSDRDGVWQSNYAAAMTAAERQDKMLLIYFCNACDNGPCNRFKSETLDDRRVRDKLRNYECVQVPIRAKITVEGKPVKLLEHPAFQEMLGCPGIAIVDYRSSDPNLRGAVVSAFPITDRLWYTPEQMAVILDLPPGTLTQRTLIYAVRIHPEKPASTDSEPNSDLLEEAQSHSQYQAAIRVQGHHSWESRFYRIVSRLPGGGSAREVCAESWPGENLVEAAIECVRCWRLSDGHWGAVRASNRCFGYDMKRGANGVWYATGIFGAR